METKKGTRLGTFFRLIASLGLALVFVVIGAALGAQANEATKDLMGWIALGVMVGVVLLLLFQAVAAARYTKSKELDVRQMQEYYLARREEAMRDLPRAIRRIKLLRRLIEVYSVVIFFLSLFMAFCIGFGGTSASGFTVFPVYLLYGFFGRLKPVTRKPSFEGYTDPSDYPTLHALAQRAAKAVGQDGTVRIVILPDCNAGIARFGKQYSLQLGAVLLDVLSEEELYQVLLHEFAHLTKDGNHGDGEYRLFSFITEREGGSLSALLDLLFRFFDAVYVFEYLFYRLTVSVAVESIADSAVLRHGTPQIAVNALAKINFYEFFERELDDYIEEPFYEPEELRRDTVAVLCRAFRRATAERADFWGGLLRREIQPRNASHPIFRLRMEALGISDFEIALPQDGGAYRDECAKAREAIDAQLWEARHESYAEQREEAYLKPRAIVDAWEASGEDPCAEEARPLIDALGALGMNDRTEALCDRLIQNTENKFATAHAEMTKGMLMLGRYDAQGIAHIYRAVEINSNYIDEGMSAIGNFCCMMGMEKELEEYRERALELGQKQQSEYEHTGSLQVGDRLERDSMPPEMLQSILDYIKNADEGVIERVYLVRKVITDSFFASVFVIAYRKDADGAAVERVMERIFNHLDTRPEDWQFSLFYYDGETAPAVAKVKDCCVLDLRGGER